VVVTSVVIVSSSDQVGLHLRPDALSIATLALGLSLVTILTILTVVTLLELLAVLLAVGNFWALERHKSLEINAGGGDGNRTH